ncbi:MAG TPA: S8 family peptidase, partial [Catenuloplanes sp.]
CHGHGTHVAGTLGGSGYGVAKGVRLVAVRVMDCRGSGYLSDLIAAVEWVTRHAIRPAVANLSLGGTYSGALEHAVRASIASGVTYVVAAGNEDENACTGSPSGVPAAITVGATDSRDRRADFSNYGGCVDLFAPGVGIISAAAGSNTATRYLSGTSMAAPHVAGAAAMVLAAYPGYRPAQVRNLLVSTATTGRVHDARPGSPNRLLFTPRPPAAARIGTATLPVAVAGRAYRTQLRLLGSRRGQWSLGGGRLPAGLRLSPGGVLSGTPTTATRATVTVRFTDYVPRAVTRRYTLTVAAAHS